MFECKWKEWMKEFESKQIDHYNLEIEIIKTLREVMKVNDRIIIRKLTDEPLHQRNCSLHLHVDRNIHLIPRRWFAFIIHNQVEMDLAQSLTNTYIANGHEYLKSVKNKLFTKAFIQNMLIDLCDSINKLKEPESHSNFCFTSEYKIDISLILCTFAFNMFKETMKTVEINRDNDPIEKLKALKFIFWATFKHQCSKVLVAS